MHSKFKNYLKYTLKALFGISVILILFSHLDFGMLKNSFKSENLSYLLIGIFSSLFAFIILGSIRLHIILRNDTWGFKDSLEINLIGMFFNSFLPSNIGGDVYKIIYLKKKKETNWGESFALILLGRVTNLFVLIGGIIVYLTCRYSKLAALISKQDTFLKINLGKSAYLFAALLCGLIIFLVVAAGKRFKSFFFKCLKFLADIKKALLGLKLSTYFGVIILTIVFYFLRLTGYYFIIRYFNQSINFFDLMFVVFLTGVIALIPLSIGGLGAMEGTLAISLMLFGVLKSYAITIAFINRSILLFVSITGGVIYAAAKFFKKSF